MLAMKSGAYFSAILLIWIASVVVGFYLMYPEIKNSIKSLQSNEDIETSQFFKQSVGDENIEIIDYSPLAIFKNL